jgi:tRNA1(Val) A37 N6-methylase TrmN6
MKSTPYKRKPGDFEIRILNNGKVIMIIPDESLMEIAQKIDPYNCALPPATEIREDVGSQTNTTQ